MNSTLKTSRYTEINRNKQRQKIKTNNIYLNRSYNFKWTVSICLNVSKRFRVIPVYLSWWCQYKGEQITMKPWKGEELESLHYPSSKYLPKLQEFKQCDPPHLLNSPSQICNFQFCDICSDTDEAISGF